MPEAESETNDEPKKRACQKCGSDRLSEESCLECGIILSKYLAMQERQANNADQPSPLQDNPYAVPQSDLVAEVEAGDFGGPVGVPIGNGWVWLSKGFWHFRQNPLAWIISMVVWIVLAMMSSLIPFIGFLAVILFTPVVLAGFILGAQAQGQGDDFEVSHLFAGFSNNPAQLVLVGLLYLIGFILIGIMIMLVAGGAFFSMMGGMEGGQASPAPEALVAMLGSNAFIFAMLLGFGLTIPLVMAYWFAPALVALEGMSAINAMKMSFVGCWKNMLPFLLYGVVALVFLFLAIPVGLGLLVMLPVMTASIYVSFRDIYYR
ncbi:BPSS1780 family membrane protein [Candidatus Vondammii sp. HM_W22]|uniref:BPSS1780 family membrane protein n=1 Tax=Candidatus Vondammii sp. HM_W22 TaxID=2687299 RepID=UPI001F1369F9|nr:BPSS1780 family membrane protein [Candidatus Vondammii sp. HM_W22]